MSEWVVLQRLFLITLLSGAIGVERERHGRAAGFRTHILVGIGSCLAMMTGLDLAQVWGGRGEVDPTRIAAQVISGIGFLGAGTIIQFRASVLGLTTAASLWAVAGIGLAVGSGFVWGAATSTLLVLVALYGFSPLERAMRKTWYRTLLLETHSSVASLVEIRSLLASYDVEIRDLDIKQDNQPDRCRIELQLKLLHQEQQDGILTNVSRLKGVTRAQWII